MTTTRRLVSRTAALVGTAMLLTSCGGQAEEDEARTITVSGPPSFNVLTLHYAEQEGYFEEVGIEIEYVNAVGSEAIPQLLGGNLDFVLGDMVTLIQGAEQEMPLVIAAPNILVDPPGESAFANVLARSEDTEQYSDPVDIEGASFGLPALNSQPWLDVRQLVEEAGGDPDSIEFTEVPNPLQALRQGQVDYVTASDPTATSGEMDDDLTIVEPLTLEELGGTPAFPYLTSHDVVENDPELVEDFREAVTRANAAINADRDHALEIAATFLDVDEEVLQASHIPVLGEEMPTTEDVQLHIDRLVSSGVISEDSAPDAADLIGN